MNGIGTFRGVAVIVDDMLMSTLEEDWSRVRSPGRARRRRKRGFPQNICTRRVPKREALRLPDGRLVMHSVFYRLLQQETKSQGGSPNV